MIAEGIAPGVDAGPGESARGARAMHACDVAVVGAGPAGAIAARQLALAGARVALIDKAGFPRDKVCGCCLSPAAVSTLASAGLAGLPERLNAIQLRALALAAPRAGASLPIRGFSVSRAAFDLALVREAVAAGARFFPRTLATMSPAGDLHLRSTGASTENPPAIDPAVILVADGLGGSSLSALPPLAPRAREASRIGVSTILPASTPGYPAGIIHMTIGSGGYAGAVRLEDGRLNIAAALDPEYIRARRGPGGAIAGILANARMPQIPGLDEARFHATPTLTRRRPVLESGRILILGDAAGYVEPFTGEGIAWALASGVAVVPAVLARTGKACAAAPWPRTHRRVIGRRQSLCQALSWGLRHPCLATTAIRLLAAAPLLARPVVDRIALPLAAPEPAP